tara:strand:- start:853 stop:1587 length:735 start_codon:yes stop_codon:yes gene_type:complete
MSSKISQIAGGIILNDSKVLIVNQKGNSWSLPKGHVEKKESLIQAAYREIFEETGITSLELIHYLGSYTRYKIGKIPNTEDTSEKKEIHLYLFLTSQSVTIQNDPDNPISKWVSINDVSNYLTHNSDKKYFESLIPTINLYKKMFIQIETTTQSISEAEMISSHLIETNLAACAHISPIQSVYKWNNEIQNDKEYKVIVKTQSKNAIKIKKYIDKHHSYDVPQFIIKKIMGSSDNYANWLENNT